MIGILVSMLQAAAPSAGPADNPLIVGPQWLKRPTAEQLAVHFPVVALRADQEGRATVRCTVAAQGQLAACRVEEESPPGFGFGEAILATTPLFQMKPTATDGEPVEGRDVRIPIIFLLPTDKAEVAITVPGVGPGYAELTCRVTNNQRFTDCTVLRTSKTAQPLGDYALIVAEEAKAPRGYSGGRLGLRVEFHRAPAPK